MYVAPTKSEEREAVEADPQDWINQLADGALTQDAFVERVIGHESQDPEISWAVLALLDQNFRRKRIARETFLALKSRLQRHSLGGPGTARATPKAAPSAVPPSAPVPPLRPAPSAAAAAGDVDAAAVPRLRDAADVPMTSGARHEPAPLLRMHAVPAAGEPREPERELLEAAFHREVRIGDLLCGRYRVVDILRRAEWMTLVEAVDEAKAGMPGVRQRVALQVLQEELGQDPLVLQRIGKLQALSHPAITRVLDVEDDSGALVLVTEFYGGVPLRELLERRTDRRVPLQSALAIVRTLAGALAHAHACGVAHGEVTTGNVLITDLGEARLQGFELRAQSHAVQPAADRMAFARLAYELLAGTAEPMQPITPVLLSKLRAPPGTTRAQWRALRDTLLGRDPHDASVLLAFGGELAAPAEPVLLHDAADPPPPRRSHAREWLAAGIVAAILGGGAYLYLFGAGGSPGQIQLAAGAGGDSRAAPAADAAGLAPDAPSAGGAATAVIAEPVDDPAAAGQGAGGLPPEPGQRLPPVARAQPGPQEPGTDLDSTSAARSSVAAENSAVGAPAGNAAGTTQPAPRGPVRASIDLAANHAWVDTTERVARIWVARRGSLNREVTFRWWTETGTAQVDRDFRAIAPRVGVIPEGARGVELLVPLMPDPDRREPRTFYVKIDEPGPGAELGTRTLMQVAIVPPGYPAARDARAAQNLSGPALP